MSSNDFYPPEDLPAVIAARERFMADPAHVVPPLRHRKKDGTIIDVEQTVHPIEYRGQPALLVTANDVTARNRVLQELRESEHKYQALVEALPVGILESTTDGRIVTANAAWRRMFGFSDDEDLGKVDVQTLYAEPGDRRAVIEGLRTDATPPAAETVFRRRDGTLFPVERYLTHRAQRRGRDRGAARHRHRYRAAQVAGGPASAGAEDGSGRPAHRRHRPRLQQHPDGHDGQRRCAGGGREPGRVRPPARRPHLQGDRPGHRPHAQPACLLAQAAAQAAERRPQRPGRDDRPAVAAHAGRAGRDRIDAGRRSVAGRGRSRAVRERAGQSLPQCARCHAGGRPAADRDRERGAGRTGCPSGSPAPHLAPTCVSPSPTPEPAYLPRYCRASSIRSSRPRKWARGRGWA